MPRIRRRLGDRRGTGTQDNGAGTYSFAQFLVILLGIFVILSNLKAVLEYEKGEIRLRTASIEQKKGGSDVDQTVIDQIVEQAAQKAATKTKSEIEQRLHEFAATPVRPQTPGFLAIEETPDDSESEDSSTGDIDIDEANQNSGEAEAIASPEKKPRIPNVLVAGAKRGATTSLAKYLADNFDACTRRTDPLFFAQADATSYAELYSDCPEHSKLFVDGSPDTLMNPEEVKKMYDEHGSIDDLKVIVTLREPVERELSSYTYRRTQLNHSVGGMNLIKQGGAVREFSEDIRDRLLKDFKRGNDKQLDGLYFVHLEKWFDLFDRNHILILSFDELQHNQTDYLDRIHSFLDLEPNESTSEFPIEAQSEYRERKTEKLCKFMNYIWVRFFRQRDPKLQKLLEDHPGPEMEQYPFPKFEVRCTPEVEDGE